ncbi:hypothetical protein L1987_17497 [Smallanthus sonchifolius]|uniref:Uncharacterized protein n=1 Tax=Smallanthus sonchifolius TaxID=185202 RepID=A0ACB9IZ38_9ASTR|nr:hypothetical protein L1987_17497 [Smallanthus sonchifolius]
MDVSCSSPSQFQILIERGCPGGTGMTKFRWNESMNMFRDHVDPEKEEQQKQIIIEIDSKVERIVKLVKSVNSGNKEAKQRKRSEVIHLIEDFYKQYRSMCALYEDLREGVKKKCNNEEDKEDNESTSSSYSLSMESAAYYSPGSGSKTPNIDQPKVTTTDGQSMKSENSCHSLEALSVESSYKEEVERGRTVENKLPNLENKSPSNMKLLEDRIIALKHEIETLNCQKSEHEQEFKGRHDNFHKRLKENSGLQLEFAFKEKEGEVLKKLDECEKFFNSKIEESMGRVQNLEMEVDSLQSLHKNFSHEKEEELESLRVQNQESETKLNKKTKEALDSLKMLERLTEKLKQKTANEEGLVEERDVLKQQVKDLEVKIESIKDENLLSKCENENQRTTISQLEEKLQEKESQIFTLESEIERVKRDLSDKMKSLEQKFKSLEIDKRELEAKNDVLAATLEERDMQVNKLNQANISFRTSVKKMGEMVDEFRKKSEDGIRILSRRIRVAEQLHNETRDWYKKTREKNEQDRKDSEVALHSIKIMISMVSDTLSVSETFGLRFVECCEAFTNRVSKVSCEINFVKDWIKRKNGALVQVKKDYDELVVQLDDKEEEILGSRQKVLKLESKLRDLEKIVKENDETMIVLKEEKREAIRQLCVWIDYQRSRSDFFKKAFFELVGRYRGPG